MSTKVEPKEVARLPQWLFDGAALLASIALVSLAAGFGASFGTGAWYAALVKPSFNPPNWIFGPVWTTLYLMMAVAAWLIYRNRQQPGARGALMLYGLQLILNALWSALFFGAHWMGIALVEILLLDALILLCIIRFWPLSRTAAILFIPYFVWVSFAAFLNFTLWRLN